MRPKSGATPWRDALRKGYVAGRENLGAMGGILAVMAGIVALYYGSPAVNQALGNFAVWQHGGGILAAACASAVAGGLLSETALVYFQKRGRWTQTNVTNVVFKMGLFFVSGAAVYEFYQAQALWFGDRTTWPVILRKVLVDQFGYSVIWSLPVQTLATRWQALGYSGARLRTELDFYFIPDRMLPVLVTNWMFWFPAVTLVYSLPQNLQMPMAIVANAIWGILLPATSRQPNPSVTTATVQDLVPGATTE